MAILNQTDMSLCTDNTNYPATTQSKKPVQYRTVVKKTKALLQFSITSLSVNKSSLFLYKNLWNLFIYLAMTKCEEALTT
jgi:hypothetical protein